MPIHHAVLAMLAAGPNHGYELKAAFEEAIGPQWGELNIGHLYQVLDRLVRDGLVTRRPVPQRGRPDRIDYRLTKAGRRELDGWLGEPFLPQGGYRDELFLKIFAAARAGDESLRQTIRTQRRAYMSELSSLGELRHEHREDPLVALLIEAAVLHTEASLRVLDAAEERVERLAELAPAAPVDGERFSQARCRGDDATGQSAAQALPRSSGTAPSRHERQRWKP